MEKDTRSLASGLNPHRYGRKRIPLLLTVFLGILFGLAEAQTRFQWGLSGHGGFPLGKFKDNVGTASGGLGLDFVYVPPRSPLGVGLSFGYLIYGHDKSQEIVSSSQANFDVDQITTNSIVMAHVLLRFQRYHGRLRPYIDGLFGFNHLRTDTRLEDPHYWDEELRTTNLSDTALSYGAGFGLMVSILERPWMESGKPSPRRTWGLLLDLRTRLIKGGTADYLRKGSITRADGELHFDVRQSHTDLFTAQLGIILNF